LGQDPKVEGLNLTAAGNSRK